MIALQVEVLHPLGPSLPSTLTTESPTESDFTQNQHIDSFHQGKTTSNRQTNVDNFDDDEFQFELPLLFYFNSILLLLLRLLTIKNLYTHSTLQAGHTHLPMFTEMLETQVQLK